MDKEKCIVKMYNQKGNSKNYSSFFLFFLKKYCSYFVCDS